MENGKYTVLVVDDSPTLIKKVASIINKNMDVIVFEAPSSKDAIRLLGNHKIDIVLMDIFMPEIDGFKTAKLMKQQELTSTIPIILMTGSDPKKELMQAGLDVGAMDYLTKPFKDQELIRLLQLYIRFISHEKKINKSIKEKNEQLQLEIAERKKAEALLIEKEKKLQESNAAKDKFFSIIAHDLKNPLGAFRQLTQVLVDTFEDLTLREITEFITEMKDSSKNLYNLLENLLFWSRAQMGQIPFEKQNVFLKEVLKSMVDLNKQVAKNKNIELSCEIKEDVVILADYNMIHTVLRNFVSNALKFTPENGKVFIRAFNDVDKAIIEVKDTGIGMSQNQIDNLFKFDKQFTRPGTNMEKGTGLGLILCREFIEKHGGKIELDSKENNGSTFRIIL